MNSVVIDQSDVNLLIEGLNYDAAARGHVFKTKNIFIEDNSYEKFAVLKKCSELRSHSPYNVKLDIITSLEQRERMLRRGKCY